MTEFSYSNVNDDTPVLVGSSQLTDKRGVDCFNYLDILKEVSRKNFMIRKPKLIRIDEN